MKKKLSEWLENINQARKNSESTNFPSPLKNTEIKLLMFRRKKGNEDINKICPFCGSYHTHSRGTGHRVAHCGDWLQRHPHYASIPYILGRKAIFQNEKGEIFRATDGYYILDEE